MAVFQKCWSKQNNLYKSEIPAVLYLGWILLIMIDLMGLSRLLFYLFNLTSFADLDLIALLRLLFIGIRFDLSAIALFDLPVIVLLTFPLQIQNTKLFQKIVVIIALILNSIMLLLNMIDTIYFRYISKRMTYELFQFFGNSEENTSGLLMQFAKDFWYVAFIWLIMCVLLFFLLKFFVIGKCTANMRFKWYLSRSLLFIVSIALSVVLFRGGLQLKPISLITAANYTSSQNVPLLINSPFSVIKTLNNKNLPEIRYFDDDKLHAIYTPVHHDLKSNQFVKASDSQNYNVVILILESFSRDYIGSYNKDFPTYTPFLDSLFGQSVVFEGFANGRRSIEGLPSILGGIPSLMNIDYPSSQYVNNQFDGLGTLLLKKGYHTSFFHGGNNGTMSFDVYARSAGFLNYFGRNEYANDADFDGKWGILDRQFLQFAASKYESFPQPFASAIFTLSSHHPYTIPLTDNDLLKISKNSIEASIRYSDRALKAFFATSSKMDWFENTIFIITADHTAEEARSELFRTSLGIYSVPMVFYFPGKHLAENTGEIAQHIDILPSAMALLENDNDTVFSFGRNVFDSLSMPFNINFINGVYQMYDGKHLIKHDGVHTLSYFDLSADPLMKNDLLKTNPKGIIQNENMLKAIIQQYNNRLIHNKLTIKWP